MDGNPTRCLVMKLEDRRRREMAGGVGGWQDDKMTRGKKTRGKKTKGKKTRRKMTNGERT